MEDQRLQLSNTTGVEKCDCFALGATPDTPPSRETQFTPETRRVIHVEIAAKNFPNPNFGKTTADLLELNPTAKNALMNDTKNGPKTTEKESTPDNGLRVIFPGDLRDWFAGMALTAVIQTMTECSKLGKSSFEGMESSQLAAVTAYQLADAMLAERNKGKP